ncbi:MAG: tandem-95 repeat protein, partial [Deltaproteobacteria bacterium]|nr:tandem-95 repeat protein [Deltaproteobacteria bacterium]
MLSGQIMGFTRLVVAALGLALTFGACAGDKDELQSTQQAAAVIAVAPITWNIIGLDSNDVTTGPNAFPVGVRVTNTGDATATNLTATFAFTTANAFINLQGPSTVQIASLAPGATADAYFDVVITRTIAARGTTRGYVVTVTGTGFTTATSPAPREVFVESLVSQARNETLSITGPTAVNVGDVVTYVMTGKTATNGYEQLVAALTLPTTGFQVLSTSTTYSAPVGATNTKIYADACGWDNIPSSPTYRGCIGPVQFVGGKAGGAVQVTYVVKVIGAGTFPIGGLIFDFSGASYHYNANFGTFTIAVNANTPPVAANDSFTTAEDTVLTILTPGVLLNDTDAENTALTASLVVGPTSGTLVLNANGSFTYTPNAGYAGPDSFTYRASDGRATSNLATVSITVTAVNDAPIAANDTATILEDAAATAIPVLANDSTAPDTGETLTITAVTQPVGGTVVITGGGTGLTFQPAANFAGTATFTYTVSDGNGGTDTATVTVTVAPVNDAPTAANDTATVGEDAAATAIPVLANDGTAPDTGETLTITSVTQPASGAVVITGAGSGLTFQPAPNFIGTATFTYTVADGNGGTDTATVTVTVNGVNDAPGAANDTATVAEDAAATPINVLANDTTAPDTGETLTITAVTQPVGGTVEITGAGTGVSFQPAANFVGTATFTYTVSDGNGGTDTATVSVTVTGVNDAPGAANDAATVAEDAGATAIPVLANDATAPDAGETLTIT